MEEDYIEEDYIANNGMDLMQVLKSDYDAALGTHGTVTSYVEDWWDLYDGARRKDTTDNMNFQNLPAQKDIMRSVEQALPDITSPFVQNNEIVEVLPKDAESVEIAEVMTKLINDQFTKGQKVLEFIETLGRNIQVEGTVFTKVGWGEDQPIIDNVPINELLLDPSARSMDDLKYVIQRRKVSREEIRNNPAWYGEHNDEFILNLDSAGSSEFDNYRTMTDESFNYDDSRRQLVEIFEYYGMLDIGNGLEPVLCIWAAGDVLMKAEPSPYPASWGGIPFEAAVYTRVPYSIYGVSLAELLRGSQNFRQLIRAGMAEDLMNSTVGMNHVKKGALDPLNRKAFLNGKRIIEWNTSPQEGLQQGTFVPINPSIFQLNETLHQEQEELSGISRMNMGMDPRSLNSNVSATAVSITNNNAQKRMLQVTRHISEMLERVFYKWIDLNQVLLESAMVRDGDNFIPVNAQMLSMGGSKFDVNIVAGTAGSKQQKLQHIQMMLSVVPAAQVGKEVTLKLIAEMAGLLDMPKLSKDIEAMAMQPNEPTPEQDMAMQLELAEKQAGIEKDNAKAMLDKAKSMETFVNTERKSYGLD